MKYIALLYGAADVGQIAALSAAPAPTEET